MNYEVQVEGLIDKDGHPHLLLFNNLDSACSWFDRLSKKYSTHVVDLIEIKRVNIKKSSPAAKPIPNCLHGHTGLIDGKPVVIKGTKEGWFVCKVCGLFQSKE